MSTSSSLPFVPFPVDPPVSAHQQALLKDEVAQKLAQHRLRRSGLKPGSPAVDESAATRGQTQHRAAAAVAERFSRTVSYRDFLAAEAEAAVQQAQATAEVARRNAEAAAEVQQVLLDEIAAWEKSLEPVAAPAELFLVTTPAENAVPEFFEETIEVAPRAAAVEMDLFGAEVEPAYVLEAAYVPKTRDAIDVENYGHAETEQQGSAAMWNDGATARDGFYEEYQVEEPEILPPAEPTVGLAANLIEFPRQLVAARKARARLAEGPLRDEADAAPERAQLRIFEVETDAIATLPAMEAAVQEWASIRLDAAARSDERALLEDSLSGETLHPAPLSLRVMAGCVDTCCIGAAFVASTAAAGYIAHELPTGKTALFAGAGVLFAFYLLYQLLFFTLSDATPGMRYARIGLCTFGDDNPTRGAMRMRILAELLAASPAGLGFIWAMMDDERMGWHDRISRMYPRAY